MQILEMKYIWEVGYEKLEGGKVACNQIKSWSSENFQDCDLAMGLNWKNLEGFDLCSLQLKDFVRKNGIMT